MMSNKGWSQMLGRLDHQIHGVPLQTSLLKYNLDAFEAEIFSAFSFASTKFFDAIIILLPSSRQRHCRFS